MNMLTLATEIVAGYVFEDMVVFWKERCFEVVLEMNTLPSRATLGLRLRTREGGLLGLAILQHFLSIIQYLIKRLDMIVLHKNNILSLHMYS